MALIPDVRKRNQEFRNRWKGLLKKCEELSKLCGIEVCLISSPLEGSKKECFKTETYPEDADEVKPIFKEYRVLAGEGGNDAKNQVTLTDVLRDEKAKPEQELVQLRRPPSYSLEGGLDGMRDGSYDPWRRNSTLSLPPSKRPLHNVVKKWQPPLPSIIMLLH